jgi:hypothetical protein
MKCLLSPAIGLAPLPPWEEGLAHFVRGDKNAEGVTFGVI